MTSLNIILLLLFWGKASVDKKYIMCPLLKAKMLLARDHLCTRLRTYVGHYVKTECQSTVSVTEAITEVGR